MWWTLFMKLGRFFFMNFFWFYYFYLSNKRRGSNERSHNFSMMLSWLLKAKEVIVILEVFKIKFCGGLLSWNRIWDLVCCGCWRISSTPDLSTPDFVNHELFNPRFLNHEFLNHGVDKFMVEKSEVENSKVEMSYL